MAGREDFEIAVVDNRLPDERGFQVISAVQKPGVSTVALLRDEDTMDRIVGIELGADYYMRSPVNPRELVARVKQIFRKRERAGDGDSGRIFVGELEIDPDQVQVLKNGKEVLLSPGSSSSSTPWPAVLEGSSRARRSSGRCGARRNT